MRSFESTILIAAEPERIWPVFTSVLKWHEWTPTIKSVEALDSEALIIGARYKIQQPKLPVAVWSVLELNSAKSFAWESRGLGIRTVADHILTPESLTETRVTLRIVFYGLLSGVVGLIAGKLTQTYLDQEAAALKQRIESSGN